MASPLTYIRERLSENVKNVKNVKNAKQAHRGVLRCRRSDNDTAAAYRAERAQYLAIAAELRTVKRLLEMING